jgi:hypothetical protein
MTEQLTALRAFFENRPGGFVTKADLPELIRINRFCELIVRCGGRRFICSAQDCSLMVDAIESAGDYVRDVSATCRQLERIGGLSWTR